MHLHVVRAHTSGQLGLYIIISCSPTPESGQGGWFQGTCSKHTKHDQPSKHTQYSHQNPIKTHAIYGSTHKSAVNTLIQQTVYHMPTITYADNISPKELVYLLRLDSFRSSQSKFNTSMYTTIVTCYPLSKGIQNKPALTRHNLVHIK